MPDHLARRQLPANGHRAKPPSPYTTERVRTEPPVIEAKMVHRVEVTHTHRSDLSTMMIRALGYAVVGWVIGAIALGIVIGFLVGGG